MPGPWDDYASPDTTAKAPAKAGPWADYAEPPAEKPFLEKLGSFARKVYENPPPSVAAARDVIKGAPAAATELTWGADPQAAEQAAGTIAQGAGMGLGFRGLGGTGVAARPIGAEARAAPLLPPRPVLPPSAAEGAVEAAGRLGVEVPRYLATESSAVPQLAGGIKNVPFAGQPIVRSAEKLATDLAGARGEIAPGAVAPDIAGESARAGISNWMTGGSKRPVSEAYKAVDALINPEVRAPLANTAQTVAEIQGGRAQARIPGTSTAVDRVLPAVQDPTGMDYAGAKMLRTWLGETTPQELVAQGINPGEAKRLYGALTKDLQTIITQAGGEGALSKWQEANALSRLTSIQREALNKIIGPKGDAGSEAVFNRLLTYANSKAGADLRRLKLAKETMGPQAWGEVGGSIISRMGEAPGGGFSADRFVTAFDKMSPKARSELFTGQQHAALADLMTVSQHVKENITKFANPSGTGRAVFGNMLAGGAIWAEPVTAITSMVGTRLAAEALSRPAVVRAANKLARRAATGNPAATRSAVEALRTAVQAEGLLSQQPQQRQSQPQRQPQPQFAGAREYQYAPGEIEANQAASFNGPQGYPNFNWVNPAGVDAFLANGPMSTNIEDRRGEHSDAEAARLRRMLIAQ